MLRGGASVCCGVEQVARCSSEIPCAALSSAGPCAFLISPGTAPGVPVRMFTGCADEDKQGPGPASSSTAPGTSSSTTRTAAAAPTARRCRRTRAIRTATSFSTTPRGGAAPLPRRAQPLLLLFRSNPPTEGGGGNGTMGLIRSHVPGRSTKGAKVQRLALASASI